MTADEAIADRATIYRIAGAADVDPRTVLAALNGRKGKGSAYKRTMREIAEAGVDLATIKKAVSETPSPMAPGDEGPAQVAGGSL